MNRAQRSISTRPITAQYATCRGRLREPEEVDASRRKNTAGGSATLWRGTSASVPGFRDAASVRLTGTNLPHHEILSAQSYAKGPKGTPEAMDMLAAILGGGQTSRLYQSLVVDKKLASSAGAFYSGSARGAGQFGVYATPRDGVSFDTLETAMDQIIRSMTTAPPEAGEFRGAPRRGLSPSTPINRQSVFQRANDYRHRAFDRDNHPDVEIGAPIPRCSPRHEPGRPAHLLKKNP